MLNAIINNSSHDTLFHYNCDGGSSKRLLVSGLVEVGWYFPSATNNIFQDAVTFVNLHGDAREFSRQVQFLNEISYMIFVFINEDDLDETAYKILPNMATVPGGVVLLRTRPAADNKVWHEKYKRLRKSMAKEKCGVIKLNKKNEADIKDDVRGKIANSIDDNWAANTTPHFALEECKGVATRCGIVTDEDNKECREGKRLAYNFKSTIIEFTMANPNESPKKLLPLQSSDLWHKWAAKDKEQYRQKERETKSIEEYGTKLRQDMSFIRKLQLSHAKHLNPMMEAFITAILTHRGNVRRYYLQWLKLILDDLSREQLPPLHRKYKEKRRELIALQHKKVIDKSATDNCKKQLEKLNMDLVYSSFGLEHLLREIGKIYETVVYQSDVSDELQRRILDLPTVAAELLIDGYPLELMDGDAAHVPISWVTAVLDQIQKRLCDPPLLVLSVLGLQSTGKSTLLNTLFGVHFSVSAGRCTRGAFMQLVPLHRSLKNEYKCDYFLVVDTEGLRAPELDALQTQNHDNQLATL